MPKTKRYNASDEFASACEYMKGEDVQENRKQLNNKTVTITKMERHEFEKDDDATDVVWLMHTKEFDLAFRVNATNGRRLAEELGQDILGWKGKQLTVLANKYNTGWGVIMNPLPDNGEQFDDGDIPY